jgi:5-methyltetrahydropteroyltriglutamate--homocysteine methyltransferase
MMAYSTERILTSHSGSLPRPAGLRELVMAQTRGEAVDEAALESSLKVAVKEVVRQQIEVGLDSINDGEVSKQSFTDYARTRIGGYEMLPADQGRRMDITARDKTKFADYFTANPVPWLRSPPTTRPVCTDKLRYVGQGHLKRDIENLKSALAGAQVAESYLTAVTPGAIEHWMANRYYNTNEEFLAAIGEVMRAEYRAIIDAGFLLQVDAPDLLDAWNCLPQLNVSEYRNYAALRVDILNEALRGIPREKVRVHSCWGSFHGPHHDDIPLKDIAEVIFRVKAGSYSIEASNPCHEHEWRVFETVKLPDGATLVPGVIGHCSDFIEHPDLVAERLVRYAKLVGRENVLAGTDCGLGTKVGHASVAWAKFGAMVEGARRASKILWGRA